LIASSSQDLMAMVEHGKFRNDLLHHINTLTIRTPSLNERRDDIPDLVRSILLEMPGASMKELSPEAMDVLCHHKYTANILELRNIIHRLVGTFETDCYSELQVIQAIHAGTPSSKSERVIEKKSQRSMLPDFKGYMAHAQTGGVRENRAANNPLEQPSFMPQSNATYASTTYHIVPNATHNEEDLETLSEQDVADDEFLAAQMAGQVHGQVYMAQHFNAAPKRPSAAHMGAAAGADDAVNSFTALKAQEREYILRLIDFCDGDKKKAADIAGVTLRTLYRKIKQ
jgi:DNA-binding NtrC family response regulator